MATARYGKYDIYYGDTFNTSEYLDDEQMDVNGFYIYSHLKNAGWTDNAIAAILGNMVAESTLNPGIWQSHDIGNYSGGYGLVQWTPATKYIDWCATQGHNDPSTMDANLDRIDYEMMNNIQWIGTGAYDGMSFRDFAGSSETVAFLAVGFLLCYERPADQSLAVQQYRTGLAEEWYRKITGEEPIKPNDPTNPTTGKTKRNRFNFVLFNKRRMTNGQRYF